MHLAGGMVRDAVLSTEGLYRYSLSRRWNPSSDAVGFIMLNPSTADASIDDPTIRRCMKFTERLGYGALSVANLFALRATDPDELLDAEDPVGPQNGAWVRKILLESRVVIAAWGAVKHAKLRGAVEAIMKIILEEKKALKCFGKTKDGQPRHPLYLRSDAPLLDYP